MSVLATHLLPGSKRTFSKESQDSITLLKGLGVEGDLHCGKEDQHEYNRRQDTKKAGKIRDNLRQVHLIQNELYDGAEFHGLDGQRVKPGQLGENITTVGIDLGALGEGAKLYFVDEQPVEQTAEDRNEGQKIYSQLMGHHIVLYIIPIALALLATLTSKSSTILYPSLALILILSTLIIAHHLSPHPINSRNRQTHRPTRPLRENRRFQKRPESQMSTPKRRQQTRHDRRGYGGGGEGRRREAWNEDCGSEGVGVEEAAACVNDVGGRRGGALEGHLDRSFFFCRWGNGK